MTTPLRTSAFRPSPLLALGLLIGLSGCAGVYRVDNRVESFARWTDHPQGQAQAPGPTAVIPAPPQTYRFERLPSQASGSAAKAHTELESMVQAALVPLGWALAAPPDQTHWVVQVSSDHQRLANAPWEDPWDGRRFGWATQVQIGVGHGQIMWSPWLARPETPYHQRRVSLVIRDARTGQVTYETSAAHDSRWNGTPALWRAMVDAALQGFPTPPNGVRDIPIDVTR